MTCVFLCVFEQVLSWVVGECWAAEAEYLSLQSILRRILLTDFLQSPHTPWLKLSRIVDEWMLVQTLCSSLNRLSVIKQVITVYCTYWLCRQSDWRGEIEQEAREPIRKNWTKDLNWWYVWLTMLTPGWICVWDGVWAFVHVVWIYVRQSVHCRRSVVDCVVCCGASVSGSFFVCMLGLGNSYDTMA